MNDTHGAADTFSVYETFYGIIVIAGILIAMHFIIRLLCGPARIATNDEWYAHNSSRGSSLGSSLSIERSLSNE